MDCERLKKTLFLYLDNELEVGQRRPVAEHLARCQPCARQEKYTRSLLYVFQVRCARRPAPTRLRLKILTSFPHRNAMRPRD